MTPSRLVLASLYVAVGAFLTRCGGDAECPDCNKQELNGLTIITPSVVPVGACAPAQVLRLDGETPVRPTVSTQLTVSGSADWYADPGCSVRASRLNQPTGALSAVGYLRVAAAARAEAVAQTSTLGARAAIEGRNPAGLATKLAISGVGYADVASCVPIWLAAITDDGAPGSLSADAAVSLASSGTRFFQNDTCTAPLGSVVLGASKTSAIAYASFGVPGPIQVNATAAGLTTGTTTVDVTGDPQYQVALSPSGPEIALQAGACTPIALSVVDYNGQTLAVSAIDVSVKATEAAVFADASCASVIDKATVVGVAPTTVYVRSLRAGLATFTAAIGPVQSQTLALRITAAPASALALAGAVRLAQGGCYSYAVQRTDAYGNLATGSAVSVNLAATNVSVFSDATCATAATPVALAAGDVVGRFYVLGAGVASGATITASATGLATDVASIDVIPAATALSLEVAPAGDAGECVRATVRALNGGGESSDVLLAENVALTTSDGDLATYGDEACTSTRSSISLGALTSRGAFYVRGTVADDYTVTITGSSLTSPGAQPFAVVAGPPAALALSGSARVNVGSCTPFQLSLLDAYGNSARAPGPIAVALDADAGGSLHAGSACDDAATVVVSSSSTGAPFYYRGVDFGPDTISASSEALGGASRDLDVVFFMSDVRASLADAAVVQSLVVDPNDSDVVWLQSMDGMIWRSANAGATWSRRCRTPTPDANYGVGLFVSPGPDGTAYSNPGHVAGAYRADDRDGDNCPHITSGLSTIYAYAVTTGITVDNTGRLFAWAGCCNDTNLFISDDQGGSWTQLYDDTQSTAYMGFMTHHPTNSQLKLVDRAFAGLNQGLYRTVNGGANWSFVTAAGFNDTTYVMRFDPAHPGYVYKRGYSSSDDGLTWAGNSAYNGLSLSWALDTTGAAYRFDPATTASTVLLKASDARTPSWTALAGNIPVPFVDQTARMSVFPDGQTLLVRSGGYGYRSDDGGAVFSRLQSPGDSSDLPMAIVAASPMDGYAVGTTTWVAFATHDGGETWSYMGTGAGTSRPLIHVNPNFPDSVYVRAEEFNSTYDATVLASQDGMATLLPNSAGSAYSWATVGAVSLVDPLVFMTAGWDKCVRTIDGGVSYQTRSCPGAPFTWYPSPNGWISPVDSDVMWFAGYNFSGGAGLWRVSWADGSVVNITARTGVTPAGIELYPDGSSYVVRVVSDNGALVSSSDLTTSFGPPTASSGESNGCSNRYLTSLVGNPSVVAHACIGNRTVVLSRNGGSSWERIAVGQCQVTQIALFANALVASCSNQAAVTRLY